MEKFIRWLGAVGRKVGDNNIDVKVDDEKVVINDMVYVFENSVERMVARVIFGVAKGDSSVKKRGRKKKKEGDDE